MRKREKMSKADKVLIAIIEVCAAALFVAAFVTVGVAIMGCAEEGDNIVLVYDAGDVTDSITDVKVTNHELLEDGKLVDIVDDVPYIDDIVDTEDTEDVEDDVSALYHTPGEIGCMSNWQTYQLEYCIA